MASDVIVKFYQSNFDRIRFEKDRGKRAVLIRDCAVWARDNSHAFSVRTDHPYFDELQGAFNGQGLDVQQGYPTVAEYLAMAQAVIAARAQRMADGASSLAPQ